MDSHDERVLAKAIDHFGRDMQKAKAIEELCELSVEIARDMIQEGSLLRIADEIADAKIMIRQLEMIYGITDAMKERVTIKIIKLKNMIGN